MRTLPTAVTLRIAAVGAVSLAVIVGSTSIGFAASSGPPSLTPASGTPHFPATSSPTDRVRQLVQCGSTMYAVGAFATVVWNGKTYTRNNAFSFSAAAPFTMTSWDPSPNGLVDTVAFNGSDCSHAYLGGKFTSVAGTTVKNLAEVDTTNGAAITAFKSNAVGEVDTMVGWNGHLLTGGSFTSINGSTTPYFASLNPSTGSNDGYLKLAISGHYAYTDQGGNSATSNGTRIYNQQLSHDGTKDLVEGDFQTIGHQARRQVAVLDLGATTATTDAWHATELDDYCAVVEPFYAKAASWSPDDRTIYVATTGYKPASGPGYATSDPRAGMCDAAIAFPATSGTVTHSWINYTGCDSLYSTAADSSTAYFGGHERWTSNPQGCDSAGPGSISAPGMVGLSPADGSVTYNPTRARGLGADDMMVTSAGLWVASDNDQGSNKCGGVSTHAGICFLPYP